jgi:hypothetical protein
MAQRLCGATGRVEKGVPGRLEPAPAGSQLQVRGGAVAMPDLLHQKPASLVPLTLLLPPFICSSGVLTRQGRAKHWSYIAHENCKKN